MNQSITNNRCLLFCLLTTPSFSAKAQDVSIAPFYKDCKAAMSLTFDDGLQEQYTMAYPQLKAHGLKATFAVIGSKVGSMMHSKQDRQDGTDGTPCMTWDMLREMAADGQEIASHGWEHHPVTRLDAKALQREVWLGDSIIEAEVGQHPMTYVYPGNSHTPETVSFCEQGRIGSRTEQVSVGSKRTRQWLHNYIDTLIARGEWGVTMTHGITRGYDYFQDPEVLWDFFDYVYSKESQLWVATFRDVAAYIKERNNTTLDVCRQDSATVITLHTSLSPLLFTHPLTLQLSSRPVRQVEQEGTPLPVYIRDGRQLVDVSLHGSPVTVTYK